MDLSDRTDFGLDIVRAVVGGAMWSPVEISTSMTLRAWSRLAAVTRTIVVPQPVVSSVTSNSRTAVAPLFAFLRVGLGDELFWPCAATPYMVWS